jgi:hypothetical protein
MEMFFNRQSAYLWVQTLLPDLFLYSYEADFIQGLLKKNEGKLARSFNFTFRYIDDVLSLNNSRFGDFVDRIYPIELEIKDTTHTDRSCWKTFPSNTANMLSIKNSSMLMMSVSENFLGDIPIDVNSLPDWSLTCSYINVNSKLPNIGYVPIFMSAHCLSVQNQTNFLVVINYSSRE